MILIRGRRKKEYSVVEVNEKFHYKIDRSSFGLWVIGSLLSELVISPSVFFEAIINQVPFEEASNSSGAVEQFCRNNPFLMRIAETIRS